MNKQNKTNRLRDTENRLMVASGKEGGWMDEKGKEDYEVHSSFIKQRHRAIMYSIGNKLCMMTEKNYL